MIYLLELNHIRIISSREKLLKSPSEYHLQELSGVVSNINYKSDVLQLDVYTIAAEYFVRICCGHKLTDGNKRMAVATLGYFLEINEIACSLSNEELRNYAIILAHEATSHVPIEYKVMSLTDTLKRVCKHKN